MFAKQNIDGLWMLEGHMNIGKGRRWEVKEHKGGLHVWLGRNLGQDKKRVIEKAALQIAWIMKNHLCCVKKWASIPMADHKQYSESVTSYFRGSDLI